MIRVTVELIPFGDEAHPRRKNLGLLEIGNIGGCANGPRVGTKECTYTSRFTGELEYEDIFRHVRADGFWELIRRALQARGDLPK